MRRLLIFVTAAALAAACGGSRGEVTDLTGGGAVSEGSAPVELTDGQTVKVAMSEFAFSPSSFTVPAGSTVTFSFTNEGAVAHEAAIGDEAFAEEHRAEMAAGMAGHEEGMPESEGKAHGSPVVDLQPGETGTLEYSFEEPGTLLIGCFYPGHFEAGMKAAITVV